MDSGICREGAIQEALAHSSKLEWPRESPSSEGQAAREPPAGGMKSARACDSQEGTASPNGASPHPRLFLNQAMGSVYGEGSLHPDSS